MVYEFKWEKRQEVLAQMPIFLRLRVETYFNQVLAGNIPHFLFDSKHNFADLNILILLPLG